MTTPHRKFFILFFILTFSGCAVLETESQDLDVSLNQPESVVVPKGIMVPQTLGPASRIEVEQKPETTGSSTKPALSGTQIFAIQPTTDQQTKPSDSQPTTSPSASQTAKVFGEFPGVSSQWEDKKRQLTIQLQEQSLKVSELKLKLQLINQVAEHISFITKASVDAQKTFLMEFTIENRALFAIKDIAITCDQVAPTGAIIRSQTETLYDIIKPSTRSTYTPIPYGNKHRQTQSLQCQITNFTVEKSTPDVSGKS